MTTLQLYLWLIGVCFLMVVGPCVAVALAWLWAHRPRFTSDYPAIGQRGRTRIPPYNDYGYARKDRQ